jgi:hypothetical protein
MAVITVSRGIFSGGKALGERLADSRVLSQIRFDLGRRIYIMGWLRKSDLRGRFLSPLCLCGTAHRPISG